MTSPDARLPELDALRVIALGLMVAFHLAYDLQEYAGIKVDYTAPGWWIAGKASALLFIFVSGLCATFSRAPAKRGLRLLGCGTLITAATYVLFPASYVRFGILHFLGTAMLLSVLWRRLSDRTIVSLALLSLGAGLIGRTIAVGTSLLVPLGLTYPGFASLDYYPLFPYLAVSLLGTLTARAFGLSLADQNARGSNSAKTASLSTACSRPGNCLTKRAKALRTALQVIGALPGIRCLSRHSLSAYFVHQPLILLVIWAISLRSGRLSQAEWLNALKTTPLEGGAMLIRQALLVQYLATAHAALILGALGSAIAAFLAWKRLNHPATKN